MNYINLSDQFYAAAALTKTQDSSVTFRKVELILRSYSP